MDTIQSKIKNLQDSVQEKIGNDINDLSSEIATRLIVLQNQGLLMANVALLNKLDEIHYELQQQDYKNR